MSVEGREQAIGKILECSECDQFLMPSSLQVYKSTPVFDEQSLPKGLKKNHATAAWL